MNAVQCLLLVGLGINEGLASATAKKDLEDGRDDDEDEEDEDNQFAAFDPDELPDLMQAMKILFPSLRDASFGIKDLAEEEYEVEMLERLRRVSFFFFGFRFRIPFFPFFSLIANFSSTTFHRQRQTARSTWKDSHGNTPPNLSKEPQLGTAKRSRNGEGNPSFKRCVSYPLPPSSPSPKKSLSYDTAVQKETTLSVNIIIITKHERPRYE